MKKIGLDIGEKTCGIAVSDSLNMIAQGKENYRFESQNWTLLINHLKDNYLKNVDTIVIGYPLLPSGDKSKTTFMIEKFKMLLSKETNQQIILIDEFGSTKKAHDIMIKAGLSRKKRKMFKDKLSATIILQEYLNRINDENI